MCHYRLPSISKSSEGAFRRGRLPGVGHELLRFLFASLKKSKYSRHQLSRLATSLHFSTPDASKAVCFLSRPKTQKTPEGVLVFWGQSPNLILTILSDQEYMSSVKEKLVLISDFR